jgi:NAD(P)-dependent dehydrogenase (short-subunit alcohol dehydrogenase family)
LLRAPHFAENTARSIRLTPCSPRDFEWRPECISVRRRNIDWTRPLEAQTPLKIERQSDGKTTIMWLIGRIRSEDLEELKAQTNDNSKRMILDLNEVTLVDADVVRFLSTSEEEGITLIRCPPYVREWIQREREEEKLRVMKSNAGSDPSNNPNHTKRDSFATKVAVVTGASRGIGLAVAKRLIANGYRVVANSRNIGSAMTLQNTTDLKLVDGDIALQETAKQVVAIAVQNFGRIDLLVNNAGVFIPKSFTEYTVEEFRVVTETNLSGFFHVSQLTVEQMRRQQFGHVVNITASLASQPIAGVAASLTNLTKGGLESVTRALAIEFAGEGIRFNAIAPGVVDTPMNPADAHDVLKQLSPLKRLARVEEVADLLLYLESAPFVNGEIVHLDGGAHSGKW